MIWSLRSRLLAGTLAAAVVVFAMAGAGLYVRLRAGWLQEFDAVLEAKAQALVALVEVGENGLKMDLEPGQMPEFSKERPLNYFQLMSESGEVVRKSESLGSALWEGWRGQEQPGSRRRHFAVLPSGRRGRVVELSFEARPEDDEHPPKGSRRYLLAVGRDAEELEERLGEAGVEIAGMFGLAAVGMGAALWMVVGRGLKPLETLAEKIEGIGSGDFSERVSLREAPAEVRPVVARVNELLAKVEANLSRERAMTADVAHELRTPLAGLVTAMQVTLSQRRDAEAYAEAMGKCLRVAGEMRGMVENLLMLARAEAGEMQVARRKVEVGDVLRGQWEAFEGRAQERGMVADWKVQEALRAETDAALLGVVVRNLMDNAVTYGDAGGRVRLEAGREGGGVVVRVVNTGSRVAAADAGRVVERFWRGDAARTGGGHCGLGLALCARIVGLLEGEMKVRTEMGGEFVVEVRLGSAGECIS